MNRTRFGRRAWIMPALLGAALAGCNGATESGPGRSARSNGAAGGAGGERPRLLFVSNSNSDWWTAVETGMRDGGKEFGCDVELRRNDKETPGQIRLLEDALSMPDVQGVAVSVYEAGAPGIADKLRALKDQGKVVITIDSDIAPESADIRRAYIGTNNRKAGEAAGRAAAAIRPEGGKTCVFVGTQSAANAIERREGFFAGAGAKFEQLEVFDDNSDPNRGRTNVQTAISKYNDLGILLGLWSYNAPAIAEEVSKTPEVRERVNVVTFDLDEAAVSHLDSGNIDVTVCQNPYEMGFQGVKLLKALIQNDDAAVAEVLPDGQIRDTGVRVIVPDTQSPVFKNKDLGDEILTIEEMKSWLQSKGLKSS